MKKTIDKGMIACIVVTLAAWAFIGYSYFMSLPQVIGNEAAPLPKMYDKASLSDDEVLANLNQVFAFPDVPRQAFKLMNAAKLRGEDEFYKNVQDGDYLVMFDNSSRAVIYRPSTHKIINLGPFVYTNNEQ